MLYCVHDVLQIVRSSAGYTILCGVVSVLSHAGMLQGYPTLDAYKDMLVTLMGCSAAEADEQAEIATALK